MADNYLNKTGLQYYHNKIKTIFAKIEDVPVKTSDITNDGEDGTSQYATKKYVDDNGGKINKIKVNGTEQSITPADKSVNITVPTKTSDLTNDDNVVKDASYVHTDNNFTTTLKTKLDGIETGAEANVQSDWNVTATTSDAFIKNKPTIATKTSDLTNDGDGTSAFATADDVDDAIETAITSVYKYKGSVANYAALPTTGRTAGDVWDTQDTGTNYAWTGTAWDSLGTLIDTSLFWAKADLSAITTAEIDTIVA